MKKKQKLVEIKRDHKQLAALKEEIEKNRAQISSIDDNIKLIQAETGTLHT